MTDIPTLSGLLWAKTRRDPENQELLGWLPLFVHLSDTAEVAALLYQHRKSRQQRAIIDPAVPPGIEVDRLIWLLAALHDVGKAGPNFQAQDAEMASRIYEYSEVIDDGVQGTLNVRQCQPINSQSEFPHSFASEIIVGRILASEFGLVGAEAPARKSMLRRSSSTLSPLPVVHQLTSILGAHHGMTAHGESSKRRVRSPRWPLELGTVESVWPAVQREITMTMIAESGVDFTVDAWRDSELHLDRGVLSLLSSLVIEADWIASNHEYFPLLSPDEDITRCQPSAERAKAAWGALGLPELWIPRPESGTREAIRTRFGLPKSAEPRPGQIVAFEATHGLQEPAMVIVEDETGRGKTEAGLLAAENLAEATGASGVIFCLPTQATTNGMYSRGLGWIRSLISDGPGGDVSTSLAHGKANLNQDHRKLHRLGLSRAERQLRVSDSGSVDLAAIEYSGSMPDESHVLDEDRGRRGTSKPTRLKPGNHTWLSGRKKRLQADFVIGTVDQLLMAGLRARHLMLRHSGLADKVVIVDEVHAADATMRLFLRKALVWLGRWGVPVVVLTATLPPKQKLELVEAYRRGLTLNVSSISPAAGPASATADEDSSPALPKKSDAIYPALTLATHGSTEFISIEAAQSRSVRLDEIPDNESALIDTIRRYGLEGGCIAVIRNSVRRVQAIAEVLRQEFGTEVVTVAHARFTAFDRAERDRHLLQVFGKESEERPQFSIVVATSVIEQSLDIDFDLMFTDLCPVDLLIQRIGRVHRHAGRTRPHPLALPRCIITKSDTNLGEAPKFLSDSEHIYGRHVLLRTAAALNEICNDGKLTSPDHIAPLVHTVYGIEKIGPADWQSAMETAEKSARAKETEAQNLAERWATEPDASIQGLDDWLNLNDGDPEDIDPYNRERGSVRDGAESIEVLLVLSDGTGWRTLDWLPRAGGEVIPTVTDVPWPVAEAIANSSIRLPFAMSRGREGDSVIAELEKFGVASWQRSPLLRGQLVLPLIAVPLQTDYPSVTDAASAQYTACIGNWSVTYDRATGLHAEKLSVLEGRTSALIDDFNH